MIKQTNKQAKLNKSKQTSKTKQTDSFTFTREGVSTLKKYIVMLLKAARVKLKEETGVGKGGNEIHS